MHQERKRLDTRELLSMVDIVGEAKDAGLRITGTAPSSDGWLQCRSIDREDVHPSAALHVRTGHYVDKGGDVSLQFFDVIARLRSMQDWREAAEWLRDKYTPPVVYGRQTELVHHYADADGNVVRRKLRYVPEGDLPRFAWQHKGKSGHWLDKAGDAPPLLYRFPQLLAADPKLNVIITEGERDTETLERLGFVATTAPNGGGKWYPEHNEHFRGRHVVICPDQDKAGPTYTAKVLENLDGIAKTIKVIDVSPAKDVSDWAKAGGTTEQIERMIRTAPRVDSGKDSGHITFIDSSALATGDYRQNWIVTGVLTSGEPGQIVGPQKSLKTTFAIDLSISIATATPFLGVFDVPEAHRVALVSAESGKGTIQETARRIAAAKGFDLRDIGNGVLWAFDVPSLAEPDAAYETLATAITDNEVDVLIADPLYLMLGGTGGEGNVFEMGQRLAPLSRVVQDTGATLLLCHHARKNRRDAFAPLELEDIAWSGSAEWSRQWMLLNRRERYDPDRPGDHKLWFSFGGSAGHSGEFGVDVTEGNRDDPDGRRWDVSVMRAGELRQEVEAERRERKETRKDDDRASTLNRNMQKIVEAVRKIGPEVKKQIRLQSVTNPDYFEMAWGELERCGTVVPVSFERSGRKWNGFGLKGEHDVLHQKTLPDGDGHDGHSARNVPL